MRVLDAHTWMQQNKKKFPNGSIISEIMTAYAKYYHSAVTLKIISEFSND